MKRNSKGHFAKTNEVPILAADGSGPSAALVEIADQQSAVIDTALVSIQQANNNVTAEDLGASLMAAHSRGEHLPARKSSGRRVDLTVDEVALGLAVFGQEGGQQ